ncbi:MAG: hypothetical protein RL141_836 [Candidatus Parcubacteria bacterium]|jgi:CxxC-x17-CxxC domain-containing protein
MYKPTHGGKPSYGSKSGGKRFGGGDRGGFKKPGAYGDRERGTPMLYDAVCAECSKKCQVPFRPNGKKPVLCRDCFGGSEGGAPKFGGGRKPFEHDARPLQLPADRANAVDTRLLREMNTKLDAILAALHA